MEQRLYTIYDRVAEECGPIFSAPNDGVALRNYRSVLQQVPKVDSDAYKLYFLATIDTSRMKITVEAVPEEVLLPDFQRELLTEAKDA